MQPWKSTLVTGASGFLGHAVMERFRADGPVVGIGHRHATPDLKTVDIRDEQAFRTALDETQPDVVVHCAAYRDPDFCETEQDETRRLNVAPVRTLVATLPATARLVFISTDYVFDGTRPPYREDDERRPVNFYGQSKLEAEDIALERASSIVLRIPLLMGRGPSFAESGFIAKTVQAVESGDRVSFDDQTMRFPTDIRDVASAIAFLLNHQASGVYHYAGERGQTQYRWAMELAALMGIEADHIQPVAAAAVRKAARPADSRLSTDRIRALGLDRFTDFREVAGEVLALRK